MTSHAIITKPEMLTVYFDLQCPRNANKMHLSRRSYSLKAMISHRRADSTLFCGETVQITEEIQFHSKMSLALI